MSTRMQALDFREEGFSPSAEEKEASSADPETTKKETKSPWCQHGGYVKKKKQLSHKRQARPSERKETGRQELQLNSQVQEVT